MRMIGHEEQTALELGKQKQQYDIKIRESVGQVATDVKTALDTALERERSERIAMEGERLRAINKRLEAHADLASRQFDELKHRMQNFEDTVDKQLQVQKETAEMQYT